MSIEAMKQALEALECYAPKVGGAAITSLRQAIAEAEKQEPYGYLKLSNSKFYQEVEGVPNIKKSPDYLPLYTHPQPKREPVACVIDGKLMAYKNGPLPDDCLLYDQAL